MKNRIVVAGTLIILVPVLLLVAFMPGKDMDSRLKPIVKPYQFSFARWEAQAISDEVMQVIGPRSGGTEDEIAAITGYFALKERIKALKLSNRPDSLLELNRLQGQKEALADTVTGILEKQISATLAEIGVFKSVAGRNFGFPPVNFKLETPPNLLVISPRDSIAPVRKITLQSALSSRDIAEIESQVDGLGVSSLVVGLGGLGATYPTFVTDEASLPWVIEAGVHEWLHQYLTFRPLGFAYVLDLTGLHRDYDVAVMNETLANILGKEIGEMVYEKYYASNPAAVVSRNEAAAPEFDFDRAMREIRQAVDSYLARGEIAPAENFMKVSRDSLAAKGYNIRKLNQAYFAFYGTYSDSPASVNPIGAELRELRAKSASPKDFLDRASVLTSRQQLQQIIK